MWLASALPSQPSPSNPATRVTLPGSNSPPPLQLSSTNPAGGARAKQIVKSEPQPSLLSSRRGPGWRELGAGAAAFLAGGEPASAGAGPARREELRPALAAVGVSDGETLWFAFLGKRLNTVEKAKCNYVVEKMSIWEVRVSSGCHLIGELSDSATADLRVKQNVDIYVESGCFSSHILKFSLREKTGTQMFESDIVL